MIIPTQSSSTKEFLRGGEDQKQAAMFSYVSAEQRVPKDHPPRAIGAMTVEALGSLSREFETFYARVGWPSIAAEKFLRALLLQVLYMVRRERLLTDQLYYNHLFRWL